MATPNNSQSLQDKKNILMELDISAVLGVATFFSPYIALLQPIVIAGSIGNKYTTFKSVDDTDVMIKGCEDAISQTVLDTVVFSAFAVVTYISPVTAGIVLAAAFASQEYLDTTPVVEIRDMITKELHHYGVGDVIEEYFF
ncbi:MAG: hypothetical protein ACHP9Y_05150 [Gammaproteobacteria bacterium]